MLLAPLSAVPASTASTVAQVLPSAASPAAADERGGKVPRVGAVLSNPFSNGRVIINKILRAVHNTPRGEYVRIAVWNLADRIVTNTLLDAKRRGVRVQVITSHTTISGPWRRLQRGLNANRRDQSWAISCRGSCRSRGPTMHAKYAIFSKVAGQRHVSMLGSFNLTRAAGERQYNDLVTLHKRGIYQDLVKTFGQMQRDRDFPPHPTVSQRGQYRLTLWPHYNSNLVAAEVRKIRCMAGSRRTVVRIAIASWWGAYGRTVAREVRRKWEQGCNMRVLITEANSDVMRIMRARGGRGPVPLKSLTVCCSSDGVPSQYLHVKAIAVRGGFGSDDNARVLFNGSPNWSSEAARSDELTLRSVESPAMVDKYIRHINSWYSGPIAHARGGGVEPGTMISTRDDLPDWFELD